MRRWCAAFGPAKILSGNAYGSIWPAKPREIVGVVGDLRHNRHDREAQPQMYVPYVQHPAAANDCMVESERSIAFTVRSTGDARRLVPALRTAVAE